MDGRRYPRVLAFLNGAFRAVLWTVLLFIVAGFFVGFFIPGGTPGVALLGWPFFVAVSVLAIIYTIETLTAAVLALPELTAEALRRTGKPKPPPVPADLVPAAAPLLRPIGRVPAPESLIDVNAWDLPVVGKRLRK